MSKSKNKNFQRRDWEDDDGYYDTRSDKQKRKEKRMRNLIRSKNVDRLMDLDDDAGQYDWGPPQEK